jgi:hypothetical protein
MRSYDIFPDGCCPASPDESVKRAVLDTRPWTRHRSLNQIRVPVDRLKNDFAPHAPNTRETYTLYGLSQPLEGSRVAPR